MLVAAVMHLAAQAGTRPGPPLQHHPPWLPAPLQPARPPRGGIQRCLPPGPGTCSSTHHGPVKAGAGLWWAEPRSSCCCCYPRSRSWLSRPSSRVEQRSRHHKVSRWRGMLQAMPHQDSLQQQRTRQCLTLLPERRTTCSKTRPACQSPAGCKTAASPPATQRVFASFPTLS